MVSDIVLDSAVLGQDRRGIYWGPLTAPLTSCDYTKTILMEFLNYPSASNIVPNFTEEETEDHKIY